jgi:ADP-ribose pyrophosphatase YjhB (NUDIX family)
LRRKYPSRPVVGDGAVVIKEGKVVLVRRGAEPALGKWSIPGGAVDLGETVRDAAIRETKEECGLEIELVDDRPMDTYDVLILGEDKRFRYHYVLIQFLARPKRGILKASNDVTDARWVPIVKVENYDLTDSVRVFFRKHRNELE